MKKSVLWVICPFLLIYLAIFSFQKIDLTTADIGRHIANGKIFLNNSEYGVSKLDILHKNLFSYANPLYPFVNHHWASGIFIYLVFSLFGWSGLSIIYFLFIAFAFLFAILTIKDEVHPLSLLSLGIFLIPLISNRTEVRPEGFSFFLLSLFIYLLYSFSKDKISFKLLFLIPFLEFIWANSHIYFIFGPFIVGIFLFESVILKQFEKSKKLIIILLSTVVATFITPYGIYGAIYPFTMFQNYGYRIVENQSIRFLENLSIINPNFLWYKITLVLLVVTSIYILFRNRKNFLISLSIISVTFAILGFLGIRHIAPFALITFPLLAYNITVVFKSLKYTINEDLKYIFYILIISFVIYGTSIHFSERLAWNRSFGFGLENGALNSTNFVLKNNLRGPIFNNYDVGGLLIYSLFPTEKVFVDNRPEAYPKKFFDEVYIPMQENDIVWNSEMQKENFNMIFFYRLDYTPWAQSFLIKRIKDPLWAPVFVDDRTIIFLIRNDQNKKIIDQFELPKEMFTF